MLQLTCLKSYAESSSMQTTNLGITWNRQRERCWSTVSDADPSQTSELQTWELHEFPRILRRWRRGGREVQELGIVNDQFLSLIRRVAYSSPSPVLTSPPSVDWPLRSTRAEIVKYNIKHDCWGTIYRPTGYIIGHCIDYFYWSDDPTNSIKSALKEGG